MLQSMSLDNEEATSLSVPQFLQLVLWHTMLSFDHSTQQGSYIFKISLMKSSFRRVIRSKWCGVNQIEEILPTRIQLSLLQVMEEACGDIGAQTGLGWLLHSRHFFLRCMTRRKKKTFAVMLMKFSGQM